MRRGGIFVLACVAAALSLPASAGAVVTIGSNLGNIADENLPSCNGTACTVTNLALPSDVALNGLTSPVNGTVTSWKFKDQFGSNTVSLRVLRFVSGVTYTGIATSASQVSAGGSVVEGPFATSLPIKKGDSVGLEAGSGGAGFLSHDIGGTMVDWWTSNGGPLADGETRAGTADNTREVMVQATVNPTNKVTFGAPVLNKKKGTATLPVHVPNAGGLSYSGTSVNVSGPSGTSGEGDIILTIKAIGKARKKLNERGKAKVTVSVTFTPTGGTTHAESDTFKLRKKHKR